MKLSLVIISLFSILTAKICLAQPKDSTHYYTARDGIKIYYEVKGSGYPLVLVHGFIVNSQSWKRGKLYYDLLTAGYKVITIDLRGNGRSDKPHDCDLYANDAEAKDIMGIVSELKLKNYSAVGYSRGSIITARLMVLDKRLQQAVMGGMGTDFTNPDWPRRIMFYKGLSGIEVAPEMEPIIANVTKAGLDKGLLACMQKEQPCTPVEVLKKVNIKVLVACGDKDDDNSKAQDLCRYFKNGTFKTVPGDHGAAVQTQQFSDAVIQWLPAVRNRLEVSAQGPVVATRQGYIRGVHENGIAVYKGIPYAQPPIGSLRYRPPVSHQPWSDTLSAVRFSPAALQPSGTAVTGSEDCLYLNLYTPAIDNHKRAVVIWVH
ncbi:MAG TPA: alpha/beta hydrolase, partial [Mucilaginibacter sp.]